MLEPFVEFTWTDPYTLLPYVDLLQHEYGLALQILFFYLQDTEQAPVSLQSCALYTWETHTAAVLNSQLSTYLQSDDTTVCSYE